MKKKKVSAVHIVVCMFLFVYAILNLYPFVYMLFYSLKDNSEIMFTNPFGFPQSWKFENYVNAWNNFNIPRYFLNSLIVTAVATLFTIIISLMFSYATARMRWKLSGAASLYITTGMFIPVQIILIPLNMLVRNFNLTNSYASIILPYIAFQLAFSSLVFFGFMKSLPYELEEAAYIDGAGVFKTFFRIICPLLTPAIASVLLFTVINNWNEFTLALVMISDEAKKTLPIGLVTFKGQFSTDWGGMGATMVLASIPTVIVYLILGEKLEKALAVGSAVKG